MRVLTSSEFRAAADILCGLEASGAAWVDGDTVVGLAADGTEVILGHTTEHGLPGLMSYILDNPSPNDW